MQGQRLLARDFAALKADFESREVAYLEKEQAAYEREIAMQKHIHDLEATAALQEEGIGEVIRQRDNAMGQLEQAQRYLARSEALIKSQKHPSDDQLHPARAEEDRGYDGEGGRGQGGRGGTGDGAGGRGGGSARFEEAKAAVEEAVAREVDAIQATIAQVTRRHTRRLNAHRVTINHKMKSVAQLTRPDGDSHARERVSAPKGAP